MRSNNNLLYGHDKYRARVVSVRKRRAYVKWSTFRWASWKNHFPRRVHAPPAAGRWQNVLHFTLVRNKITVKNENEFNYIILSYCARTITLYTCRIRLNKISQMCDRDSSSGCFFISRKVSDTSCFRAHTIPLQANTEVVLYSR